MHITNEAREWILKELTVNQFIEMVEYENELFLQSNTNIPKTLNDLKTMQDKLNNE